jgi:hypothetical protein
MSSASDVVDGFSTGTLVPRMWVLHLLSNKMLLRRTGR